MVLAPVRVALATGLSLLGAWPAGAACPEPQDLLDFQQAVHRQLACELADRLLSEEGCQQAPVPECGVAALEQLAELVPRSFGDRLLASWGYSGASCRLELARASELTLHELLTRPIQEAAEAPAQPHASRGGRPSHSGDSPGGAEESEAQQAMSELEQVCDGVDVGLRSIVGGSCAMLGEWGDVLDGPRLRGCLAKALGRIAEDLRPGSSPPPSAHSGHGRRGAEGTDADEQRGGAGGQP